ncbi:MAG: sodium-translocating pyrophosphatase [Clostridia bacterium]|nr:sodium-translocating pyrophosphatase [Clostridia bacterium]
MSTILYLVVVFAVLLGLGFAALNFFGVKKLSEGTEKMQKTAAAIRLGANTFVMYEMRIIAIVAVIVAAVLCVLVSWQAGVAFLIGAVMSECAGFIGMKIATYANVRVTNAARETKHIGKTLKVAFRGGSVMGLCVAGFALLGAIIVYLVFGLALGQINVSADNTVALGKNLIGLQTVGLSTTVSGYALGCSLIALFNRVGGGIYTKAADMGADLVGKTEAHIAEDDPRNPATIADNVGDNVGDVAGLGSDLLESFVAAIMSSIILACELVRSQDHHISVEFAKKMMIYPLAFAALGLIGCVIGIATLVFKSNISDKPEKVHSQLNGATWLSAGITAAAGLGLTWLVFREEGVSGDWAQAVFKLGWISPWVTAAIGILAGIIIGIFAEYYTSYDYKPTRNISHASKEGAALTITQGLALGMISCLLPVVVLGVSILASFMIGGMYGVGIAAMGMLSFVAATVSVDTYGPISDNAGGIAEMCELDPDVRKITDKLDSVGNTTAAIGKGFAIGSAALAALSMMSGYIYSYLEAGQSLILDIINANTLMGAMIGAALPFFFSGLLINAVAKAARNMVDEVRRQFNEIPGLLQGTADPDYKTCIEISSKGAISEMKLPAVLAIAVPVVTGFIFGPKFVGGLLIGATLSAIMLAIFTGNAGGAWDNAKKYIESGAEGLGGKGSPEHDASVVGDTVGDPLKDTVGPSLDIFIKIMSVVSVVMVVVFKDFNLFGLLGIAI